ncbi:hypothetical protein L596_014335 [Steinernema carpocapsae]|uniref:RBR-type E3 ubiquitin transferase n=1 Tax=Steinernema carpocapsae TaxID=34508 RepID=A0A4U5NBM3_STECR|nr:hypothetical protein L596_014335 [Steinernema carpocapsae]
MSVKMPKKSLGTVVECSETVDDCTSLLVEAQPQDQLSKDAPVSEFSPKRSATLSDSDVEAAQPSSSTQPQITEGGDEESPQKSKKRRLFGFKRSSEASSKQSEPRETRRNPLGVRIADFLNNLTPGIGAVYERNRTHGDLKQDDISGNSMSGIKVEDRAAQQSQVLAEHIYAQKALKNQNSASSSLSHLGGSSIDVDGNEDSGTGEQSESDKLLDKWNGPKRAPSLSKADTLSKSSVVSVGETASLSSKHKQSIVFSSLTKVPSGSLKMQDGETSSETTATPPARRAASQATGLSLLTGKKLRECPLCVMKLPVNHFPKLTCCSHRSCRSCLVQYLQVEIMESRIVISCPECSELLHPTDIYQLMSEHPDILEKYENFSLRRILMTDPDTRWCPAPDCTYAVIASSCAACPQLQCERPGCGTLFCYHCKSTWHANQTCDEARRERGRGGAGSANGTGTVPALNGVVPGPGEIGRLKRGDIKACPRCRTYIVKMNDGSCNHMVCAMCSAEFCWLCLKEISDLHYLSPTGCTFWGKKPWTRKKKLLWQIGTLIGAPVGIALIAGLAIPGIICGVPVFVGRKVHQRFIHHKKMRRRLVTAASIAGSLVVSPVLAVMAVGVGVPIMLAYVYGVVPLSLCRNGGCGSSNDDAHGVEEMDDEDLWQITNDAQEHYRLLQQDNERHLDGTSVVTSHMSLSSGGGVGPSGSGVGASKGAPSNENGSVGTGRLQVQAEMCRRRPSVESGITSLGEKCNYEEASTKAMAGSQYCDDKSVHTVCSGGQCEAVSYCEEIASTRALAGSVHDAKSLTDSSCGAKFCSHHTPAEGKNGANAASNAASGNRDRDMSPVGGFSEDCVSCQGAKISLGGSTRNVVIAVKSNENGGEVMLMSDEAVRQIQTANPGSFDLCRQSGVFGSTSSDGSTSAYENNDPFHVRAMMDTLKQMVADDLPTIRSVGAASTSGSVSGTSAHRTSGVRREASTGNKPPSSASIGRSSSSKSIFAALKHSSGEKPEEPTAVCATIVGPHSVKVVPKRSITITSSESVFDQYEAPDAPSTSQEKEPKRSFLSRVFWRKSPKN